MLSNSGRLFWRYLEAVGLLPLNRHDTRRAFATVVAMSPPVFCAWLAGSTGHWELFERSGSITAAVGLLLASGRYVRYGVLELAMLDVNDEQKPNVSEMLEDAATGKLGLALSAFGSVIWGWGTYLGWWCFTCVAVWVIFVARDWRRDSILLRNRRAGAPAEQHPTSAGSLTPNDQLIAPLTTSTTGADPSLISVASDNQCLCNADITPSDAEGA